MPQPSSRERKPSTKQVIINGQKLKKAPQKRRKKSPDPEEISIGDSSEEAPEVVHISEECDTDAEDIILLDGLKDRHNASLPVVTKTKADSTQDLLLVFSDRKSITFKSARDSKDTLKGRWCNVCRKNARENKEKLQKSFFTGSNSTCRQHIRQHYEMYSQQCKENGIMESE
ncbi:hypothetical protein EDB89DRAFT_1910346 [Lactarius sanguifluus]|nr:hypothetical protein EDB89DRAFT_1910346 [Lactarius sanguifluus]